MTRRVHVIGIGGAGLSAIARVLHERGDKVSGSDLAPSEYSRALERDGVTVTYGHRPENVAGAEVVLASSAVREDNPEVLAARQAGIAVLRRADFLSELTQGLRTLAVAGTHGKTTTTALIAWILDRAGLDPSFVVGGTVADFDTNARAGGGEVFVIEADEYDRAFLGLQPSVAVITNVEHDHPDLFPTLEDVRRAFEAFVDRVQDLLIVCADDAEASTLARVGLARATYGLTEEALWRAEEIRSNPAGGSDFLVLKGDELMGLARIRLPGEHNVRNALAAVAAAEAAGVPFVESRKALVDFHGVSRRFEILGQAAGVTVIDDYAHHPSEIRATLRAARQRFPEADLWAVFQPHTFSRLRALMHMFAASFVDADHVIVTEIFASREPADPSVSARALAERIEGREVHFVPELEQAAEELARRVGPGSVVVTLSAGDGNQVGRMLLERLAKGRGGSGDG